MSDTRLDIARARAFTHLISCDSKWSDYLQIGSWHRDMIEAVLFAVMEDK